MISTSSGWIAVATTFRCRRFTQHINLKEEFASVMRVKPCGMSTALKIANLPLVGTHHRGIDDARNIARLAQLILY